MASVFEKCLNLCGWRGDNSALVRFIIIGGVNTLFCLATIFSAKFFFKFGDFIANLLGYSIGIVTSFLLNRAWSFQHSGAIFSTALRFLYAVLASYLVNLVTVYIALNYVLLNGYLAQIFGMVAYTIALFILSKIFVFK